MRLQMSAWLALPLLLLACWGAPRGAEAYGDGAPKETCGSMTPGHGMAVPSLVYSINVSGTTFTNTSSLTVTVNGTYQGVIMQARAPGCSTPVGTWATPPADTKVMQCSSASDTMTIAARRIRSTPFTSGLLPRAERQPASSLWRPLLRTRISGLRTSSPQPSRPKDTAPSPRPAEQDSDRRSGLRPPSRGPCRWASWSL
ncbi:defense protein l(2)34Fc-like [Lethenteron reissneri]|uniref:defense protein l(2)34Fc-like n=1 Tax=Lethenteron reissneri TaxID=7753 RepID=UPI002AB614C6|nr:defense protein l(2)34Fc-like [Lethenteron reissneri]